MKIGSKHLTHRAAVVTAVGCSAVLIGGGTVAWSAVAPSIPGPDGVIHSCYNATGSHERPTQIPPATLLAERKNRKAATARITIKMSECVAVRCHRR